MQTSQTPEVRPSDVIALAMREGIEAALEEFPDIDEHRAALQRLLDTDAELTALERKASEAQGRLDAADRELSALISASNKKAA